MFKKLLLFPIFFTLLLLSIQVSAQKNCAFDDLRKQEQLRDPNYIRNFEAVDAKIKTAIALRNQNRSVNDTFYIPLVVHVLHNGSAVGAYDNPTDATIISTIDYLNKVFNGTWAGAGGGIIGVGDINVKFVLATKDTNNNTTNGIDRINCSGFANYGTGGMNLDNTTGVDRLTLLNLSRWDPFKYYNIWVVNKIDGCGGVPNTCPSYTAGFAIFPYEPVSSTSVLGSGSRDRDGTVMLATGMTPGNAVLPHEIGHALSLYHPFEGADAATNACPTTDPALGDKCADTDPINNPQGAGNAYPAYARDSFPYTAPFTNTCTGTSYTSNTEKNIMNYTFKNRLFTANQKERMKASCMTTIREGLTTSWANNRGTYPTTWVAPVAASATPVTSATGMSSVYAGIYRVELNDMIVNSLVTSAEGGYVNKANKWYDLFKVQAGTTYSMKVNIFNGNSNQLGVFIDYNNDGIFNNTTENVYLNTNVSKTAGVGYTLQVPITFTVPASGISTGSIVRMRIINDLSTIYGVAAVSGTSTSVTYGQAEDYPIYLASVPCTAPAAPTASGVSICSGNTASLSATGSGTLKWYSASTGGTLLATASTYTTPTLTTNTTYYVQDSTCAVSATRTSVLVTVNALPVLSANAGGAATVCAGSTTPAFTNTQSGGTWSIVSGTGTASVNTGGVVTGLTAGTVSVKYTYSNGTCSNSVNSSLTVTTSSRDTTVATSCGMYIWETVNQSDYFTSGTYSYTENCVTHVLILTVNEPTSDTTVATSCGMYVWETGNLSDYMSSGTYSYTENCATHVLELTVNEAVSDTLIVTETGYYTWQLNGNDYYSSGTYTSTTGCQTRVLILTIIPNSTDTTFATSCGAYLWPINFVTYSESGTYSYSDTYLNYVLVLTVNQPLYQFYEEQTACGVYNWATNGVNYATSGMYTYTTPDCIEYTLFLTITEPTSTETTVATTCGTYVWQTGNFSDYSQTGTYSYVENCVLHVLDLTVNEPSNFDTTVATSCGMYIWETGNYSDYFETGTYSYIENCTKYVLELTIVEPTNFDTTVATSCGMYIWETGNYSDYFETGIYSYIENCTKYVLDLTIVGPTNFDTTVATSCGMYTWEVAGYTNYYFYSGTYSSVYNCTEYVLELTVNQPVYEPIVATSCGTYTWETGDLLDYSESGTYYYTENCVTYILDLTIVEPTNFDTTVATSCGMYVWENGNLSDYMTSGTYSYTENCVTHVLLLTVNEPTSDTTRASICQGGMYIWDINGSDYFSAGTYSYFDVENCIEHFLILTVSQPTIITRPTSITQTLLSNVCGARRYRFSTPAIANATGYEWSFDGFNALGSNLVFDSGDVYSSRVIVITFSTNAAATTTDSIRVKAYSGCGNSAFKGAKLTNTALKVPSAPTAITITPLITNVCGIRLYRYSAPSLPVATTTTAAATGYLWFLEGALGANATIDSGDIYGRTIVVRYTSNAASAAGDTVRVIYLSDCGASLSKATKLTNTALSVPAVPTAITITPLITNLCGLRVYRYSAPNLPAATTTTSAANGYNWELVGSLSEYSNIDSGDFNSQKIVVSFTSNAASAIGDSIKLFYASGCGNSASKSAKLSNTLLKAPGAPTAVTITPIQTNVCSARRYRYSAPNLPVATALAGAASGYVWDVIGSLSSTMTIDSGDLNSQRFTVTFTSNAASAAGDSVRVFYTTNGCGNSARKSAKLSNTKLGAPLAPTTVTIQQVLPDVCFARKYRYIAPAVLPGATTTAGAASGYLWSAPTGPLGSTGTIDSGEVTSRIITVTYTSNAAAGADSIRLRYTTNGCGNGVIKAQKLSNVIKTGCVPPITKNTSTSRVPSTLPTSMEVKVYPNPTTTQFNVQVKSSGTEEAVVRVLDVTGRFIKSVKVSSNSNVNLGSDLKAGAYMLEVRQGKEVKTVRVMKF
jgi:hypothetical protein